MAEQDVIEEAAGEAPEEAAPSLSPEQAARRRAALAQVRQYGDPVLRAEARPVTEFDEKLRNEVVRMGKLMDDAYGIGLAATQVGILARLLVYKVEPESPVRALVNPEIEWAGKEEEWAEEGCLSLPAVHVDVKRPVHIRVRAKDEHGEDLMIEATGLEARVIQHEVDHLDGVLILDHAPRDQRKEAMRAMRAVLEGGEEPA